ncbi:MAG: L-threonine 3-dehydrogenase [Terriglobales bacterium]
MASMQALVKPAPAPGAELRSVRVPELGPHDVLVRVRIASICGTDLHIYEWDEWSRQRLRPPLTFGHEFCGTVERVGEEVEGIAPGDYVSAEMHVPCGRCLQCRTGQAHICERVRILGVDADGCFAELVRIPAANILKLDAAIPPEYGAILDPLGNAVHTVLAGDIAARSVAIVGCGPIGLMAIAVARACGAGPIFALEPNPRRRALAQTMQADRALDPRQPGAIEEIAAATAGGGVDVSLEFSGHGDGVRTALRVARAGARVSLLGIPAEPVTLDLARELILKGLVVQGIHGRRMFETWHQMLSLLRQRRLDLGPLFTDRLPLAEFAGAMERLKRGEAAKVLLFPNGGA